MEPEIFERLGLNTKLPRHSVVNGKSGMDIMNQLSHPGDASYRPCAEAFPGEDVMRGSLYQIDGWNESEVFPGTSRDIVLYRPARSSDAQANVLLFNDGQLYLDPAGSVRVPAVLDSLIATGAIPPTVAVFVSPGEVTTTDVALLAALDHDPSDQRSYEYDRLTEDYACMLIHEILPLAAARLGATLSTEPERVAVCGASSGGVAAFNAAWHLPERFGNVISHCGSFTNIHGGHNYPYLVRMTPRKPIRVWMQSGENDAQAPWGSWPMANKVMADALAYAGYDVHFEFGTGAHSLRHGGSLFAETLRWLWGSARR